MSEVLRIFKVFEIPEAPVPNAIYIVKHRESGATDFLVTPNAEGRSLDYGINIGRTDDDIRNLTITSALPGLEKTDTDPITAVDTILIAFGKLQAQIDDLKANHAGNTVFESIPSTFSGAAITVTQPVLRQFVWDYTNSVYIRAPWNQPGILKYSYTNPAEMNGYLPVDGKTEYDGLKYPELAELLGMRAQAFRLMPMGGKFIRTLDTVGNVDPGRELRSDQGSATFNITGGIYGVTTVISPNSPISPTGAFKNSYVDETITQGPTMQTTSPSISQIEFDASGSPGVTTANEVRPINTAFPLWISY